MNKIKNLCVLCGRIELASDLSHGKVSSTEIGARPSVEEMYALLICNRVFNLYMLDNFLRPNS